MSSTAHQSVPIRIDEDRSQAPPDRPSRVRVATRGTPMRLTTDHRWRGPALALVGLALAGCDGKPRAVPASGTGTTAGPAVVSGSGTAPASPGARKAADAFLQALTDGKASPAQLTPAFRAHVGKTDQAAQEWLAGVKGKVFHPTEQTDFGSAVALRGGAETPPDKHRTGFAVRLVRDGDAYKADWLQFSEHTKFGVPTVPDPDLAAALDTVHNFLDLLIDRDEVQTHALLAPALRKSLSPVPVGTKPPDGLDYDPGFLTRRTRAWVLGVANYTVGAGELGPNKETATFPVTLEAGGDRTPATVKLVKDKATGWWLIDEFSK